MVRTRAVAARREQALLATCEVIAERGFRSLTIADVAKRIGTSTGTVHYHFATKRELLHAAFEYNFERSLDRRRVILRGGADTISKLRDFVDSYLPLDAETMKSWRVWAELWVEALHDPDLQVLNERFYGEWRALVAGIIAEGQRAGVLRSGDPVKFANMLIGLIDGLAMQVMLGSRGMNIGRMRALCHRVIDSYTL